MPGMIKNSEDAIPLETTGTKEVTGVVKMDSIIEGEAKVETEMTEVDIEVTEVV